MFSARSRSFAPRFLCFLWLTAGCAAFASAGDSDAWLTRIAQTLNAGMPPHNDEGPVPEERVYVDRHLVAEQDAEKNPERPVAAVPADLRRGRLLYETHCIACHTTQAHWRDKHIVKSWSDLLYAVTRMQKNAGQEWGMNEILDVAGYLNELFYKMPCPVAGCRGTQAGAGAHRTLARER